MSRDSVSEDAGTVTYKSGLGAKRNNAKKQKLQEIAANAREARSQRLE
jgi:hypothetical protein